MEQGQHREDPAQGVGRDLLDLETLRDDIAVRDHDRLGQARGPRAERQKPTHVFVLLALRQTELLDLTLFAILLAHGEQLLHGREPLQLALQQEHVTLRNSRVLGRRGRDLDAARHGEEEFRLGRLQRVRHLLDVVRGTGARHDAAGAQDAEHRAGIPDRVGGEERDGLALQQAIVLGQRGGEVSRVRFEVDVREVLSGVEEVVSLTQSIAMNETRTRTGYFWYRKEWV